MVVKKGDLIELSIEDIAPGGKGITHVDDFAIFVHRSLPGQLVKARIIKRKKNYAEARVVELIQHSPGEIEASCPHFGVCGGCLFQNLSYEKQLQYKHKQVVDTLQHLGGFNKLKVTSILPSPDIYYYRNKMEFSFSDSRWLTEQEIKNSVSIRDKNFALGLHIPGRYDKVLDIQQCFLLSKKSNEILNVVKNFAQQSEPRPYSTKDHNGFYRFLVIREGKNTGQTMINIVTSNRSQHFETLNELSRLLMQKFPAITTIVHNINDKKAQIATGDEERILYGPGYIFEKLGKYEYRISANSFFQTNTHQAENLYNRILQWGDFSPNDIVYDLYSGTGSIAVFIAAHVQQVVGFEIVTRAIEDAEQNCRLNNIDNCTFVEGDLKEQLSNVAEIKHKFGEPDTIIIDPPRSGLHPRMPEKIIELTPSKIIYVSCNPATLARDLKILCQKHYHLEQVQPIDMFPHTAHCEVIALLKRSN